MLMRVITDHFDPPKTSGIWLGVEHFYGLKKTVTANSLQSIQRGHFLCSRTKIWAI